MQVEPTMPTKTFLVEDNHAMRQQLTEGLEALADVSIVQHATNPTSACAWLLANEKAWDLAIVDLGLEGGSGLTVLAALRVRDPAHHVVVMSNSATPELREKCAAMGAERFFDKSTELGDLVSYCRGL